MKMTPNYQVTQSKGEERYCCLPIATFSDSPIPKEIFEQMLLIWQTNCWGLTWLAIICYEPLGINIIIV